MAAFSGTSDAWQKKGTKDKPKVPRCVFLLPSTGRAPECRQPQRSRRCEASPGNPPSQRKIVAHSYVALMYRIPLNVHTVVVQVYYYPYLPLHRRKQTGPAVAKLIMTQTALNKCSKSSPSISQVFSRVATGHLGVTHPN